MRRQAALAVVVSAVLAACALKQPPDNAELMATALPNLQLPSGWMAAPVDSTPVTQGWLVALGDSGLLALVTEVLEHNTDLEQAAARVDESAGRLKLAGGKMLPTLDLYGSGGIGLGGDGSGLSVGLLRARWEVDLWGRVRYGRAAASDAYLASSADLVYAQQSLAAMAAKSWFLAAEVRLLTRMTDSLAHSSVEVLKLTEVRRRVGTANDQDVALARADVGFYHDRLLQLEQSQQEARRAMEVLAGRYPAAALQLPDSFPATLPLVPAGLPMSLLDRRPDIQAADLRVGAAFYATQEAVAARLPSLSLTASFGAISSDVLELAQDFSNPIGSIGANLLVPLFHGGQLKAQVKIQTAGQRAAVAAYGGTVLAALLEVENALGAERMLRQRDTVLAAMVSNDARAVEVSQTRFRVGQEDLLPGLLQRQRLYNAETALIRVRTERVIQRINLHLAVGGGFVVPPVDSVTASR